MRALLFALLVLATAAINVAQSAPKHVVMRHNCDGVTAKKLGLRCTMRDIMHLHWLVDPQTMATAQRELAVYEYNRLILLYGQLGGRWFHVTRAAWGSTKAADCNIQRNSGYLCFEMRCKADGSQCEQVD